MAALFLTRIVEPLHGERELLKLLSFTIAVASAGTVAVVTVRTVCGWPLLVLPAAAGVATGHSWCFLLLLNTVPC